jgi:ABC-type dipeptide/oligopeptide/nickel transport system ATPase subunit
MNARVFEDKPATRERVPLLTGLMGPSGGGKTYSALRLATGIQRVTGGDIFVIDTEARRALHYADKFKFRHVVFSPPFGPLDYLAAVEHCVKKGAGIIIVDSMSHEHEGPGGVLEMHQKEVDRLAGNDWKKAERVKMLAWSKPKQERRRLINALLQIPCNFVFCFRAKEKLKIVKGEEPKPMGFMPIAGEEFVFEMTVNCLLLPGAGGVPTWQTEEMGEKQMIKLPEQFRDFFSKSVPLNQDLGEQMAKWAAGDALTNTTYTELLAALREAPDLAALEALTPRLQEAKDKRTVPASEFRALRELYATRKKGFLEQQASEQNYDSETGEVAPDGTEPPAREAGAD